jgi:hypothetical protein
MVIVEMVSPRVRMSHFQPALPENRRKKRNWPWAAISLK